MGKLSRKGVCGGCLLMLALPAPAGAHGPTASAVGERALARIEARQIGPAHAAEHARQRRAARRARALTPAVRRRARLAARRYARATADEPADSIGRWQPSPIQFPTWAINSVLLPTGKVLIWSRAPVDPATDERVNESPVYVWDPAKSGSGAFERVDAPGSIFCSGQSLLASGEVFVAGGTLEVATGGAEFKGLDRAFTFDPWALTWKEQPRMRKGRWYPSQVMLADGRIAIVSGEDESGTETINPDLEVFTPAAQRGGVGTMTRYPSGEFADVYFYPHLHLLPNGKVAMASADAADAAVLDPTKLSPTGPSAWTSLPQMSEFFRGYAGSVLLPAGPSGSTRVAMIGGATNDPPGDLTINALATSEVIDLADPGAGWDQDAIPDLHRPRWNHNVVMLPDGSLATVGGGAGERETGPPSVGLNYTGGDQELKRIELLRPGVDSAWRLGPAQQKWRTYHSTALLLPDGRVLSAGDDYWDAGDVANPYDPADQAEIYEPPYLFDGDLPAPRPAITAAPGALRWGDDFGVPVLDTAGRRADRAVLVAPSATTHGTDMNQRHVELEVIRRGAGGLDLRAPAGPALAPPGFYMLFVLDESGTPSVARWVELRADAADAPLLPAPPPDGQAPPPAAAQPPPAAPAAPTAARDTRAPRTSLSVRRRGRTLRLRVGANEAATVTLAIELRSRSWKRTVRLASRRARRTVILRLPAGWRGARLRVRVAARDAAGNVSRRRITRTLHR